MTTVNPYYVTIRNLRTIRLNHKITQGRIAKKAGIPLRRLRDIENGNEVPDLMTVRQIALALQLDITVQFRQI